MFNYCVVRRLKKKILNNAKLQVRTKEKTLLWESRSFKEIVSVSFYFKTTIKTFVENIVKTQLHLIN